MIVSIHGVNYAVGLEWQAMEGLRLESSQRKALIEQFGKKTPHIVVTSTTHARASLGLGAPEDGSALSLAALLAGVLKDGVYLARIGNEERPWWMVAIHQGVVLSGSDMLGSDMDVMGKAMMIKALLKSNADAGSSMDVYVDTMGGVLPVALEQAGAGVFDLAGAIRDAGAMGLKPRLRPLAAGVPPRVMAAGVGGLVLMAALAWMLQKPPKPQAMPISMGPSPEAIAAQERSAAIQALLAQLDGLGWVDASWALEAKKAVEARALWVPGWQPVKAECTPGACMITWESLGGYRSVRDFERLLGATPIVSDDAKTASISLTFDHRAQKMDLSASMLEVLRNQSHYVMDWVEFATTEGMRLSDLQMETPDQPMNIGGGGVSSSGLPLNIPKIVTGKLVAHGLHDSTLKAVLNYAMANRLFLTSSGFDLRSTSKEAWKLEFSYVAQQP